MNVSVCSALQRLEGRGGAPLSGILSDSVVLNMYKVLQGSHVKDMAVVPHTFLRVHKGSCLEVLSIPATETESEKPVKAVV